ncbi:MAG: hypothetical protein ACQKBU_08135, partial [Verrucomicrobiales bacterium]
MIRYFFWLLVMVLIAVIAQQFLPAMPMLANSRILLVPLIFLCGAVTLPTPLMLALAFVCGFLTDAESTLGPHGGDLGVYLYPTERLRFGYSILLYGAMGFIMQGIQPLFRQGRWQVSTLLTGISVFIYLLTEYILINFIRGGFTFHRETFFKIAVISGLTTIL